ncbi:MAG: methylenetetrahydrofolate reductase C-terminal domain-containing protein [Candidatus Hydrothermarchaeaceae archaeon]
MIVRKLKDLDEIRDIIGDSAVVIIGCAGCYGEGGLKNVDEVAAALKSKGVKIIGRGVTGRQCGWIRRMREKGLEEKDEAEIVAGFLQLKKEDIEKADILLSMACGVGAQTLSKIAESKLVAPAFNTEFMGRKEEEMFYEQCIGCGNCIIHLTGGICPVTGCPKSDMNGPCGGVYSGKCEVERSNDCVWSVIYRRLKDMKRLDLLKKQKLPKDFSIRTHPRKEKV